MTESAELKPGLFNGKKSEKKVLIVKSGDIGEK